LPEGADDLGVPTVIEEGFVSGVKRFVIGLLALDGGQVYRNFKLGLGSWRGDRNDKKFKAAEAFISRLFEEFTRRHAGGIGRLVVTVP
jgi:hypothetical protein